MPDRRELWIAIGLALAAALAFYFSTRAIYWHFDYTLRIANALLSGHTGLHQQPPPWLTEFVPFHGRWYSVFPLGAVLSVIPVALLQKVGLVHDWAAQAMTAVLAGLCVFFFYRLTAARPELTHPRRVLLALFPVFGTWMWANLGLGGAWQIPLAFAVLGQAAALYYTLVRRNGWLTGAFLALAIGNRTEIVLTLPLFLWLWAPRPLFAEIRRAPWPAFLIAARIVALPAALLLATAIYNYARFGSPTDFGYSRIPGVLNEPWYRAGLFSFSAIRWNLYEMLFRGLIDMPQFPYLRPHAFGCSIFVASPFLFLLFRDGAKHAALCWTAMGVLVLLLWVHGNAGGWQFSYRYGLIAVPWMFLLILENGARRLRANEVVLFALSVAINALATYEFLWTNVIRP